tara:strand:- start:349 stop:558 length:210 start_codon:yes stop_codon:yes gene_type:complete
MTRTEIIDILNNLIEEQEWLPSFEEEVGQWFDKWEQDDCEARGYHDGVAEGTIKAYAKVIELLSVKTPI